MSLFNEVLLLGKVEIQEHPRQRIQLSFVMKPETFKKIQAQREKNAQWLRCKVEPIVQGAPRLTAMAVSEDGVDMNAVGIFRPG